MRPACVHPLPMEEEQTEPQTETPEDGMRQVPTDPPEVVPAMSAEQLGVAAGLGLAGFAKQNSEGGFTGDEDVAWTRDEPQAAEPEEPAS